MTETATCFRDALATIEPDEDKDNAADAHIEVREVLTADGGLKEWGGRSGSHRVTLRPRKVWTSDDDDTVLILRVGEMNHVTVTCTVTADGYNELFEAGPISVEVQQSAAFDAMADLLRGGELDE